MSRRAHLDVPAPTLGAVAAWIAAARRATGCRPGSALPPSTTTCCWELLWMRHHDAPADLVHEAYVCISEAYRYLYEPWTSSPATPGPACLTAARDRGLLATSSRGYRAD